MIDIKKEKIQAGEAHTEWKTFSQNKTIPYNNLNNVYFMLPENTTQFFYHSLNALGALIIYVFILRFAPAQNTSC